MHHTSEDESRHQAQDPGGETPQTLAELLATVQTGVLPLVSRMSSGAPHLRLSVASFSCLLPLDRLGGVLAERPRLVHLPYSPEWMLGVFPHRAELVALVDPAPVLTGLTSQVEASPSTFSPVFGTPPSPPPVLIVGGGERTLAWTVQGIADIVYLQTGEVVPPGAVAAHPAPTITPRYISGIYTANPAAPALVLDVDRALDDMLAALKEEEEKDDTYG